MHHLGFESCLNDPDVWRRTYQCPNGDKIWGNMTCCTLITDLYDLFMLEWFCARRLVKSLVEGKVRKVANNLSWWSDNPAKSTSDMV
jgi:hypothetical protein